MATIKEWVRDFRRLKKWDRFTIFLTILSFIIGFGFSYLIFEINIFSPQNMTGNYCVNCFKVSQIFESKIIENNINQALTTTLTLTNRGERGKFNSRKILVILPNNQKAFIPVFYLYNTIEVAYCDPQVKYCNINSDYVLNNEQIKNFDFINYSFKYKCEELMECSDVVQRLIKLNVCEILFTKNLTESYDRNWLLNLNKDCI